MENVYVGVENLCQRTFNRRWLLTFGFGLIHGLGFASVLQQLGIGTRVREAVTPLLLFNSGVEVGQILIAVLVLPLIWNLKRRPSFLPKYVPACSIVIALIGGYWLIVRLV